MTKKEAVCVSLIKYYCVGSYIRLYFDGEMKMATADTKSSRNLGRIKKIAEKRSSSDAEESVSKERGF